MNNFSIIKEFIDKFFNNLRNKVEILAIYESIGIEQSSLEIFIFIVIRYLTVTIERITSKGKYTYNIFGNREFG